MVASFFISVYYIDYVILNLSTEALAQGGLIQNPLTTRAPPGSG